MPSFALDTSISPIGWRETLIGGQCFRWRAVPGEDAAFYGQIDREPVTLELENNRISWNNDKLSEERIRAYLAIGPDYDTVMDQLPWRSDESLAQAMEAFVGLRILKQPIEEVLFCFLCSSVKSIPQIQEMLELVSRKFGDDIGQGQFAFPGWAKLLEIGEQPLRELKLGYRAKYVAQTAERVSPEFFVELQATDYATAKAMLVALPGVGEKIADCVCSFGLGHLEAFPVDTWIIQAMSEIYGLEGWSNPQIAHFGRTHFGAYAGVAQQFLFSWMRGK